MAAQSQELSLREKTDQVIATLNHPAFLEQIEQSLPENVTLTRFVRVATTSIRGNGDLVSADQTSLFASIVKCAQDGLFPDGREAALVIYKGKVGYLPMIGGIRKIAAVFGWAIRTSVVYSNDEFDYSEEPPAITHRPVRPGVERGDLIYAYAVATHRDGRRMQTVLHPEDIAKRRAKAQTDNVWREWTPQMWEKTAGHDIFKQLPLDPNDARVASVLAQEIEDPAAALYGPRAVAPSDTPQAAAEEPRSVESPATDTHTTAARDDAADRQQAEDGGPGSPTSEPAASVPGDDFSDEPGAEAAVEGEVVVLDEDAVTAAGETVVPNGVNKGKTLAQIAAAGPEGEKWLLWCCKSGPEPLQAAALLYAQARVDGVWSKFEAWQEEQS